MILTSKRGLYTKLLSQVGGCNGCNQDVPDHFPSVYLMLGLVAVMLVISVFTSIPELDMSAWFRDTLNLVRLYLVVIMVKLSIFKQFL